MTDAIETISHDGCTIEIHPDFHPMNPREECDNLGTIWTQERRHKSPDDMPCGSNVFASIAQEFGGKAYPESMEKALDRECVWLPVWKYEHSGVAYRASASNPFFCPWDSGAVGYVFVRKADVRKEYGVKRITKAVREKALAVLQGEVEEYSRYANGEAYGFKIMDHNGDEIDSCWGFDDMAYCIEAAKEACPEWVPIKTGKDGQPVHVPR